MDVKNPNIDNANANLNATIRVGDPQPAGAVNGEQTIRPTGNSQVNMKDDDDVTKFMLKGRVYRSIRCLSDNSGEAQVFLVEGDEGEMVLKVYYPKFTIQKTLMRIIQNFHLEMIVRITDFGKTYVDGKSRDYELMEYLQGGTLGEYTLDGDFSQFRRIALQCAAALAYCHNNNVIHKDIKPGNFFFRDKEHTEVVLGDFGISSVMDGDVHRTTQARTPVYAAPEMYSDVIDGEVEITPAADFYSLGITLLTLWLGENPLSQNERDMMRKKNEGRLPRVNELPERVKMIIQGLTAVNPQSRWGYEDVERWFLGEDVKVDISSPLLKYRSFVVDPERNLVADNVHELIPLLLDNERLARNYLYSGRIAEWLEQSGNIKLSTALRDIVLNRYPVDQRAGLQMACYVMEPSYPYRDLHGNLCDDLHSVAISILSYQEEYTLALRNPNDNVFLFIESHSKADISRLRSYFTENSKDEPRVAILKLVYEIDPEVPFLVKHHSGNIASIVHSFGYEECSEDEWISLSDGRLLSWLYSHEDKMTCESLRLLTQDQEPSRSLGYKALYNLHREAAFDLREANTPELVGKILCEDLKNWQHLNEEEFALRIADYSSSEGRFMYYAQLHGWYEQISLARACFDLKSEENRERMGAYDLRTAAYRFCRQLGVTPVYLLDNGTLLTDGAKFDKLKLRSALLSAVKRGSLAQWMSVFYHEDPNEDFIEEYSYERRLEQWLMSVGEIDQNNYYYKRYMTAKRSTSEKTKAVYDSYKRAKGKERCWRTIFYGLCALWILLLIVFGVSNRTYLLEHSKLAIMLPVGGVSALIVGLSAFFRGYGFIMCSLLGMIGVLSSFIPIGVLQFVNERYPSLFVPAIIVLTVIYIIVCNFSGFQSDSKSDDQLLEGVVSDDVKSSLIEPLYYTFKQKSYRYKGSKFGMLDDVNNQVRSLSGESVLHYMLWSLMVFLLLMEIILFSPSLGDMKLPDNVNVPESVNILNDHSDDTENVEDQQSQEQPENAEKI